MPIPTGPNVAPWANRAWRTIAGIKRLSQMMLAASVGVIVLFELYLVTTAGGSFITLLAYLLPTLALAAFAYLVFEVSFVLLEGTVILANNTAPAAQAVAPTPSSSTSPQALTPTP